MCVPGCQETILQRWSRRNFLKGAMTTAAAVGAAALPAVALAREDDDDHWKEHGHMDAPIHFSADQDTADMIPVDKLVCPLVVVDIRRKARRNPDAQLTVRDLRRWERRHGRIPKGACVAMYSGWEERLATPGAFRNADGDGVMHFPGFHVDAVEYLLERREVNGIAVDTLSLDYGPSADFVTHYLWLGNNKWGMENVANLGKMPPHGATFIAGGPKIAGATGGPSRCIGLVHDHHH